jgi:hypothetical protein
LAGEDGRVVFKVDSLAVSIHTALKASTKVLVTHVATTTIAGNRESGYLIDSQWTLS